MEIILLILKKDGTIAFEIAIWRYQRALRCVALIVLVCFPMLALRLRVVESVTMWMVAAMVFVEGIAVERSDEKKKD